jgi:hypothetical protein
MITRLSPARLTPAPPGIGLGLLPGERLLLDAGEPIRDQALGKAGQECYQKRSYEKIGIGTKCYSF